MVACIIVLFILLLVVAYVCFRYRIENSEKVKRLETDFNRYLKHLDKTTYPKKLIK